MTNYNDINVEKPLVANNLTKTQFENAVNLPQDELYFVDPEFTGNKALITNSEGNITERTKVEDLTSTSITLETAAAGTDYHYGTLTALTITAVETADVETLIYFTADSTGISVSLPATIEYIGSAPYFDAGKKYVISILNNILVSGRIA